MQHSQWRRQIEVALDRVCGTAGEHIWNATLSCIIRSDEQHVCSHVTHFRSASEPISAERAARVSLFSSPEPFPSTCPRHSASTGTRFAYCVVTLISNPCGRYIHGGTLKGQGIQNARDSLKDFERCRCMHFYFAFSIDIFH